MPAVLQAQGYEIDYDDWHADVHGTLPYVELLPKDVALRKMLQSIPLPKHIFTNADTRHAAICLDRMGIADCFQAGAQDPHAPDSSCNDSSTPVNGPL